MVTRVTTPGNYSAVLANLLAAQQRQMDAGDKVATQKNGDNLKDYSQNDELLTSMQSLSTRLGVYQNQNKLISQKLSTQSDALNSVADAAQNIRQVIADAIASDRVDTLMEDIQSQMSNAVQAMNARFGGKYLFAGGQVDTQPVTAATMADLTSGPPISSFFQNDNYQVTAQADESTTVKTGILASDIGTEMLNALQTIQQFHQSGSGPFNGQMTAAQRTFLTSQLQTWDTVRSDVTAIAARNGVNQQRVSAVADDLTTRSNSLQGMIGDITDADMAQASSNLQQAQLSVQAAAYVYQALQQSSLINILK